MVGPDSSNGEQSFLPANAGFSEVAEFQERREGREPFALRARHLLAVGERGVSPEDEAHIQRILGMSVADLAGFGGEAFSEHRARNRLQQENADLKLQTITDLKTGAFTWAASNFVFGEAAIEASLQGLPMFCLFADLNSLKYANDIGGAHKFGDLYLTETVNGISEYFKGDARIIRLNGENGDELVIVGTVRGGRRATDQAGVATELTEIQQGLKGFIKVMISNHPQLSHRLIPAAMRAAGVREAGISVGGVFMMPSDLDAIGAEVLDGSRYMEKVIERVTEVADSHMYLDKHGRRPGSLQFEYDDLFPGRSKFRALLDQVSSERNN